MPMLHIVLLYLCMNIFIYVCIVCIETLPSLVWTCQKCWGKTKIFGGKVVKTMYGSFSIIEDARPLPKVYACDFHYCLSVN